MNVLVIETERRRDGKRYAVPWPPTREQVNRRRWLSHDLVCGRGLSIRQAQAAMLAEHGVRRSIGAICQDVRNFECPACASQPQAAGDG